MSNPERAVGRTYRSSPGSSCSQTFRAQYPSVCNVVLAPQHSSLDRGKHLTEVTLATRACPSFLGKRPSLRHHLATESCPANYRLQERFQGTTTRVARTNGMSKFGACSPSVVKGISGPAKARSKSTSLERSVSGQHDVGLYVPGGDWHLRDCFWI